VVAQFRPEDITRDSLIEAITGGAPEAVSVAPAAKATTGDVILQAQELVAYPRLITCRSNCAPER